jgi:hypothetical protein
MARANLANLERARAAKARKAARLAAARIARAEKRLFAPSWKPRHTPGTPGRTHPPLAPYEIP